MNRQDRNTLRRKVVLNDLCNSGVDVNQANSLISTKEVSIGSWVEHVDRFLLANEGKAARERLTLIRIYEEGRALGYEGSYDAVRRSHYLVQPVACTPASGWGKGQVENQVGLVRERFFTPRLRIKSLDELNVWLLDKCIAYAKGPPGRLPEPSRLRHLRRTGLSPLRPSWRLGSRLR
jgi:hypothetical protein